MYTYKVLSKAELEEIKLICDRWLPPKHDKMKYKTLNTIYTHFKNINFNPVIKAFTERLNKIPWEFSKSEKVSGSICFFGGVITSLLNYGYIEEIEGLFTFAVCYMLIDHFIDDINNSDEEKSECIKDIYNFIMHGEKSHNKLIQAVADRYLDLINRKPNCRKYFIKLFLSEAKGLAVQKNSNLPREDYLKIAEEKGGLTSLCIASIIGLEADEENNFILGSLIQVVDDIEDIQDDMAAGIYTLARYDMDHGNLDGYLYDSFKKIDNLSPIYSVFKIILMSGIILGVHDNPGSVSDSLYDVIKKYNIYFNTSKDELIEWFYEKLADHVDENDF